MQKSNSKIFRELVLEAMEAEGMTQAELVRESQLVKSIVNKIINDQGTKGGEHSPSIKTICSLAVGLKLDSDAGKNLICSVYPHLDYIDEFLDEGFTIDEANEYLYDNDLPTLGSDIRVIDNEE